MIYLEYIQPSASNPTDKTVKMSSLSPTHDYKPTNSYKEDSSSST